MNAEEMQRYEVAPSAIWNTLLMMGAGGYDVMERIKGWSAIPAWGKNGWDLGSWPLVIIFWGNRPAKDGNPPTFDIAYYVEGDVTTYKCPTAEIRNQITDTLAFFHWKAQEERWVKDYQTEGDLPPELRGPFSFERMEEAS
jgi:hypothetical protein